LPLAGFNKNADKTYCSKEKGIEVSFSLTQKSELKKIIFILFLSKAAW